MPASSFISMQAAELAKTQSSPLRHGVTEEQPSFYFPDRWVLGFLRVPLSLCGSDFCPFLIRYHQRSSAVSFCFFQISVIRVNQW
jgi:hypothetical protein